MIVEIYPWSLCDRTINTGGPRGSLEVSWTASVLPERLQCASICSRWCKVLLLSQNIPNQSYTNENKPSHMQDQAAKANHALGFIKRPFTTRKPCVARNSVRH